MESDELKAAPSNRRDQFGVAALVVGVLLILAIGDWPYGYYQFLRIVVCLLSACIAYRSYLAGKTLWMLFAIGMAILYNPVALIHLDKDEWGLPNFISGLTYLVYGLRTTFTGAELRRWIPRFAGVAFVTGAALVLVGWMVRKHYDAQEQELMGASIESPPEASMTLAPEPVVVPPAPMVMPTIEQNDETAERPASGPSYIEALENGITLTFVPTAGTSRLIEWRQAPMTKEEDGTCQEPYSAKERVTKITYAYGLVIDRFETWNATEGKQEYMPFESNIARVYQPSLHDVVREGRTVSITKQRCGMGQVESLVAVGPA